MERPEEQTPIIKKSKEIQQLIMSLVTLIEGSDLPDAREVDLDLLEDDLFNMKALTAEILSNVMIGSSSNYPYDMRMESAVLIKKACLTLLTYAYSIEDMGLKDIDYLDLIYEEIEAFRMLFVEWIKTFELWKYDEDDWGLFHPEGIEIVPSDFDDDDDDDEFDDDDDDHSDFDSDNLKEDFEDIFKNLDYDLLKEEEKDKNEDDDDDENEDEDEDETKGE